MDILQYGHSGLDSMKSFLLKLDGKLAAPYNAQLFSHQTHHKPLPTPRPGSHTRVATFRQRGQSALKNTPATIPCTSPIATEYTTNMVRYVTLCRYLDEIPPSISF